jgi:uncharacterized membrane protein
MKLIGTIIFLLAFVAWAYLEFFAQAFEGPKEILFWVGMGAMLLIMSDRKKGPIG